MAKPREEIVETPIVETKYYCPVCEGDVELSPSTMIVLPFGQTNKERKLLKEERKNKVFKNRNRLRTMVLVCDECEYIYLVDKKKELDFSKL